MMFFVAMFACIVPQRQQERQAQQSNMAEDSLFRGGRRSGRITLADGTRLRGISVTMVKRAAAWVTESV